MLLLGDLAQWIESNGPRTERSFMGLILLRATHTLVVGSVPRKEAIDRSMYVSHIHVLSLFLLPSLN